MTKPYRMHLFVPPHLPSETRWTGPRLTVAQLKTQFCVDHVHCLTQYATFLKDMQSSVPTLDLTSQVEQLRVKKTKAEIQVLKKANRITHASFLSGLKNPWKKEHEGMAFLEYQMKSLGAQKLAYVPVVASGQRTCVLHYTQNDQQIHEGDLVLVDAGCQFGYYASDITRTFPASKHFTQPQRELYNAVLNTQEACLKHISPLISLDDLHTLSVMYLTEELNRLDFRTDKKTVSDHLYFHHLGHYLGLDVHDTPSVSRGIPLQSGMVITLEPGVYVPPSPMFPSKYHGIGIRIEDNVVIRSQGYDLLTNPIAPRTVDEIESLRC
ncbi:Xaa-Pro aminopeptidase 3 [Coelomomyces lativittatus]|nr:Xaa-Pro aminopeptidase 3 [Coelomomyces lativittatus]